MGGGEPSCSGSHRPATLAHYTVDKVLSHDSLAKEVALLGRFEGHEGQAVVRLSRQHFHLDAGALAELLAGSQLSMTFENDIYSKFLATVPASQAAVLVDVVHPATARHVAKATEQPRHLVRETPQLYTERVLPFIRAMPASRLQWVANILDKSAEAERLIFEDAHPDHGFMLHPDLKWDQVQPEQLYCLALCRRRDVYCLRDLSTQHLPLLRAIRDGATKALSERYGVAANDLRMFVHYPPSYYHFHVHVTHVKWLGSGAAVGKAHLLDDIIDNIEVFGPDFYQRRTLACVVGEDEELWQVLHPGEGGS